MSTATNSSPTASDYLKYAAARLSQTTDWATDSICGSCCEGADGHEAECDAINATTTEILAMAAQFGDPRRYSDGRRVVSSRQIDDSSIVAQHVWHPDPTAEPSHSWRGVLPHDPGEAAPGVYEVSTDPMVQEIFVRVVRTA
ncbi:hypothetical protein ACNUDN_11700 [Mycobacterium sp. smrl_JER01]|uniref:hypothetical protein n=1 Tax=Mycobacterium sp. smrl_JER01 TaxID=3402633 RepID=UPI003AC80370